MAVGNGAQIAAIYLLKALHLDALAQRDRSRVFAVVWLGFGLASSFSHDGSRQGVQVAWTALA